MHCASYAKMAGMKSAVRGYLGLDLGTTNIKAQVIAEDGRVLSSASASVGISYGADGAVVQDFEDIWSGTRAAVGKAASSAGAELMALGISSQGGAMQVLDRKGCCFGPVIGWQDSRGAAWDLEMTERLGRDWYVKHIGVARSLLTGGQILRLRGQGGLPPDFRLGWVGDLIVERFCGQRAHDQTSLSNTGLLNPAEGREDEELLGLLGLERGQLPKLIPAKEAAGKLLPRLAADLGLPPGMPVGPAVHDQYAATIGCGTTRRGDTMLGAGTAWVLIALADILDPPVGGIALVTPHPVPGLFGQMLSMVNGGACITWALKLFGRPSMSVRETDELMALVPPGSEGLRFRPLLSDLGAAGLPPGTAGRLDGLRLGHTQAHVLRSLMEGLACELGRYLGMMAQGGISVDRLVMCGKAATSAVTPGIIADTTGLPVDCISLPETSSLGAAMLARALVDPGLSLVSISDSMLPPSARVEPGPGSSEAAARLEEYLLACKEPCP